MSDGGCWLERIVNEGEKRESKREKRERKARSDERCHVWVACAQGVHVMSG